MIHLQRSARLACMLLVAGLGAACGGGSSGGSANVAPSPPPTQPPPPPSAPPPPPPSAPANPIVYVGADSPAGPFELYLVDPAAPGVATKINSPIASGGVGPFALSPDLSKVAYLAYQESATVEGLYLVDLATPGTSVRVNGTLIPNAEIAEFEFSHDSTKIVYRADQDTFTTRELYVVDLATPGVSTKLNPPLPQHGDVLAGFSFSADDTKVLYAADQDIDGIVELYLADLAAPGVTAKVNPPFSADVSVTTGFRFSPDGQLVGYIADQDVDDLRELYAVSVASPGTAVKLNGPLIPQGDLCAFEFSPDSTRVAYCADQDTDGLIELYLVDIAVPGVSTKLNPPIVSGGDVSAQSYRFSPDGTFIIYRADQDVNDVFELYRVDLATPGVAAKVNGPLTPGGDVANTFRGSPSFRISPDGLRTTYLADQDVNDIFELYTVDLGTPGASLKLNPPVSASAGGLAQLDTTADGLQIIYRGFQGSVPEIHRVEIAGPGVSTTLNAAGHGVLDFAIAPGRRTP